MYTIKEAAQQTGLTEYSLRFYTDRGLDSRNTAGIQTIGDCLMRRQCRS